MSFLALMRYSQETKAIKENSSNHININKKSFYQKMKDRMDRMYLFFESYKKS